MVTARKLEAASSVRHVTVTRTTNPPLAPLGAGNSIGDVLCPAVSEVSSRDLAIKGHPVWVQYGDGWLKITVRLTILSSRIEK